MEPDRKSLHLAATLKKLLVILLLLVFAGSGSASLHKGSSGVIYMQEACNELENVGNEQTDDCILNPLAATDPEPLNLAVRFYGFRLRLAPPIDELTPPPDLIS